MENTYRQSFLYFSYRQKPVAFAVFFGDKYASNTTKLSRLRFCSPCYSQLFLSTKIIEAGFLSILNK